MPDKKEELENQIAHMIGYEDWGDKAAEDVARDILSLLAPILADAEKWRKVKALSKSDNCSGCIYDHENDCVLDSMCCFSAVVDALDWEEEKEDAS